MPNNSYALREVNYLRWTISAVAYFAHVAKPFKKFANLSVSNRPRSVTNCNEQGALNDPINFFFEWQDL